jgi:S1-C subfamily serine protease
MSEAPVLETWLFDLALLGVLVAYAVYGWRTGLVHSLAGFAGVLAGAVVAFFLVPVIGNWVPDSRVRILVVVASGLLLILGGQTLGTAIGRRLRGSVKQRALRVVDRALGAAASLVATALVLSLLSSSAVALGIPALSRTIASSTVLRVIGAVTPDPLESLVARVRSVLLYDGLPAITEALGGIVNPPTLPDVDTGSPALAAAAQSVVRITGTAPDCGQNQAGSGFVVSDERVITNAHVLAGVSEPIIETPGGQALGGTIVYFDPIDDLAVIAVPGLSAAPLVLADTAADGQKGVINGYPFGGPFVTSPAEVLSVDNAQVYDIYRSSQNSREVYTLATEVNVGDSGGPFLTLDGTVAGVVFAKAANTANVGYAMTMAELDPVAAQASSLTAPVSSGACSRG